MENDITLPRDIDMRLLNVFTTDIDTRLKTLTHLVSLQEDELSLLWYTVIGLLVIMLSMKGKK